MEGLVIQIDWVFFLGIIGALVGIAWYSGSRFSKIETNVEWLKKSTETIEKGLDSLRVDFENKRVNLYASHSPVQLTKDGQALLHESGLKEYIDSQQELIERCKSARCDNSYEVQQYTFELFDSLEFEKSFDTTLKQFAFDRGLSIEILRRVGGIYFRDICLNELKMNLADIDRHAPAVSVKK